MSRYGLVVSASWPEVAKGKVVYSARMRHLDVIRGRRNGFGARRDRLSALWRDGGWNGFVRIAEKRGYGFPFGGCWQKAVREA